MEKIVCQKCKKDVFGEFVGVGTNGARKYRDAKGIQFIGRICTPCRKSLRAAHLRKTKNAVYKKYEKTKNGFLMRAYRNMKSRVNGIQHKKAHLYQGKSLLNKEEFYDWSLTNKDFNKLFEQWEKDGYPRRTCPSIDRIDSGVGYELTNMQWVPFHVNCLRGLDSRYGR